MYQKVIGYVINVYQYIQNITHASLQTTILNRFVHLNHTKVNLDVINFTTTFTIQRFSAYVFRYVRIALLKMEISPIVFECQGKM